jgi:hypothetical protein
MQSMTIDAAAIRLTETILGEEAPDLEETLKAIALNIGVLHIAYAPLCLQKSVDANLFRAVCTYPPAWQARYFMKQYAKIDPVIAVRARRFCPLTGMNCRRMTRRPEHFLTTRLITMWATPGCRSPFETGRVSVLWFPSRVIIRRTNGQSINRGTWQSYSQWLF